MTRPLLTAAIWLALTVAACAADARPKTKPLTVECTGFIECTGAWGQDKEFNLAVYESGKPFERKPLAFADRAIYLLAEKFDHWPAKLTLREVRRNGDVWCVVEAVEVIGADE